MENPISVIFAVLVLVLIAVSLFRPRKKKNSPPKSGPTSGYPYRPGIEFRLPDGRLTTRGYAAVHPGEFRHWEQGPEGVYGENIDRTDWENWRINYYGM